MKIKYIWLFITALLFSACDDNTGTLGIEVDQDVISSSYATFQMHSTTIQADSILSNSSSVLLGQVTDPETQSKIKADFLAQFHTMENYSLPKYQTMKKDERGEVVADSIEVRLYFQDFYGDSTNVMKMSVYELDTLNVIEENKNYYSQTDLSQFVNPKREKPLAEKVFTARDFMVNEGILEGDNYYHNVRIKLPREYGSFILNKYYQHPEYFKNSYAFIHHVCPGFYFKLTNGDGTMLYLDVSTIDIHFTYTEKDSVKTGMTRFAATGEVIQSTQIQQEGIRPLIDKLRQTDSTMIKTPAGLYTEIKLPIREIYQNHENDSVSNVKITLNRYNSFDQSHYAGGIPMNLLMIRKEEMYRFFEEKKNPDNVTSFVTSYNTNQYAFGNISRLISKCRQIKQDGMKQEGLTEEAWIQKHPDWDKVVLIPVNITKSQSGIITNTEMDLKLNSIRLEGEKTPIPMYVVYSKFNR